MLKVKPTPKAYPNKTQPLKAIVLGCDPTAIPKKQKTFTDIDSNGILGLFDETTSIRIIRLIEEINHNAEVA
jgi:hypothetical protein